MSVLIPFLHFLKYLVLGLGLYYCHTIYFLKVIIFLFVLKYLSLFAFDFNHKSKQFLHQLPPHLQRLLFISFNWLCANQFYYFLYALLLSNKLQTEAHTVFILMLTFVSLKKTSHCVTNVADCRIGQLTWWQETKGSWLSFCCAIPDWFGEVLSKLFEGILYDAIRIDDVIFMAQIHSIAIPIIFCLIANEGINFSIEHSE